MSVEQSTAVRLGRGPEPHDPGPGTGPDRRWPRSGRAAALVALTAAVVAYAAVASGVLGPAALLLLLVAILGVPTHALLVRRVALNVALFVGWAPVLWWVDWPFRLSHAGVVLAAGCAVTAAVLARRGWRTALPVVRRVDAAVIVAVAVVTGYALHRWYFTSSPRDALVQLLPGADNWAHFNMFVGLRANGATPEALGPAPDGSGWAFANYPKGFHGVVATVSELLDSGLSTGPSALVVYAQSVAVVVLLGILMVVAAVLSLGGLAARPAVTLPTLVLTSTGLLWEPGQKVLANGFANFWLASVGVGVALLLGLDRHRPDVVKVAAVTGLIVLVCHAWTPLVLLALPAVLLVLLPYLGRGWSGRGSWAVLGTLCVGALASLKAALLLFSSVSVGYLVSEESGFDGTSPLPTFALLVACLYVLVVYGPAARRRADPEPAVERWQTRCLLLVPTIGVVVLSALLVAQVRAIGTTSYYFLKLLLGFELTLVVLAPALVALLVDLAVPRRPGSRARIVLSVLMVGLATQAFGHLTPAHALLFDQSDDGTAAIRAPYDRAAMADGVLRAVASTTPEDSFHEEYLALGRGNAIEVFYPDAWFHAVNGSTTDTVMDRMAPMRTRVESPARAGQVLGPLLAADETLRILTTPQAVRPLRRDLSTARVDALLASRNSGR